MSAKDKKGDAPVRDRDDDPYETIYQPKYGNFNFDKTPQCIYFHYLGPPDNREPYGRKIRHYYKDIGNDIEPGDVEELIRTLALNAKKDEPLQNPPPCGADLNYLLWIRKSYLAFLIDDPTATRLTLEFWRGRDDRGLPNHSFFDGWSSMVDLSPDRLGSYKRPALCCINHMKRTIQGSNLGRTNETFRFKLNVEPPPLRGYPDSGGTNMGPPLPPP